MTAARAVALLLLWLLATPALAQTPSSLAEWQYSAGRVLEPYFRDEPPEWQRVVGLVVQGVPHYEGADRYHLRPGMVLELRYKDIAFASTGEGVGVNLLRTKGKRVGVAVTYDIGRDADEDDALTGMGDLKPTPEGKVFAEVVLFPLVLRADVRDAFGGHGGWTGDLSAYLPVAGSKKFFVMVGPSISLVDQRAMRGGFGVSPEQSARSGYPVYQPGGGVRDVRFGVDMTRMLGQRWMINLTGAAQWLLGEAADSPLVRDQRQYVTSLAVGYTW